MDSESLQIHALSPAELGHLLQLDFQRFHQLLLILHWHPAGATACTLDSQGLFKFLKYIRDIFNSQNLSHSHAPKPLH
jgi:hypothetical protein